jgi:phosphomannomutase
MKPEIFKAYDIRGIYPTEIDEDSAYRIGKAFGMWLSPKKVVLGRDVRVHGKGMWDACARGLVEVGVDVIDIGVISTDMLYFAVANYGYDGGITITASHNPAEYSGAKIVREESRAVSIDTGLADIRDIASKSNLNDIQLECLPGEISKLDIMEDYLKKNLEFVNKDKIKPLKVVVNTNFGASYKVVDRIAKELGMDLITLNFEEDGTFPKGPPDPLLPENSIETSRLIKESRVDFGVAWDADADRCFFYDEKGDWVHPIYITGLLIEYFLKKNPGSKILVDPRIKWLPETITKENGGELVVNKSGHSFIKDRIRKEGNVVFGAETSAHYYFKDYFGVDNGMIPFLTISQIVSENDRNFSELIRDLQNRFPVMQEYNFKVSSVPDVLTKIKEKYSSGVLDEIDGISIEYPDWRFNLRGSNTEPVIRLNLEAKTKELISEKFKELEKEIAA